MLCNAVALGKWNLYKQCSNKKHSKNEQTIKCRLLSDMNRSQSVKQEACYFVTFFRKLVIQWLQVERVKVSVFCASEEIWSHWCPTQIRICYIYIYIYLSENISQLVNRKGVDLHEKLLPAVWYMQYMYTEGNWCNPTNITKKEHHNVELISIFLGEMPYITKMTECLSHTIPFHKWIWILDFLCRER